LKKLFCIFLIYNNLFAWEVNTHRAIDRKALDNVPNLNTFVSEVDLFESYASEIFEGYDTTYFEYVQNGELNGMSLLQQDFPNKNYLSLLEAGSMLEDAQWPHAAEAPWWVHDDLYDIYDQADGRFLNHFYNPQESGGKAVGWAFDASRNDYDYVDAIQYFAKGFSEAGESERRKYQAKMFVSVGQMMQKSNNAMQEV
jgi:hypothetical protein